MSHTCDSPRSRKPTLTPDTLFTYALDYSRLNEESDGAKPFPTLREAARHFGTTLTRIEETCGDYIGNGYLRPAVGFRTFFGVGTYEKKSDWLLEVYE